MNTPAAADRSEPISIEKRKQRFSDFALLPGDAEFLPLLSAEQRTMLQTPGRYKERAAQLNLPIGTVRSRLHRARAALLRLREQNADSSGGKPAEPAH